MRRALLVLVVAACAESNVVVCGDDRVCPAEYACDEIHGLCVLPAQLVGCAADDVTTPCTLPGDRPGQCNLGVCLEIVCGDGIVAGLEDCEPGDGTTFDCVMNGYYDAKLVACSDRCVFPESECSGTCGDAILNGPVGQETCEIGIPPASTCFDFGYEAGRISCNTSACGPNLVDCKDIGFVPFIASTGAGYNSAFIAAPGHVFLSSGPTIVEVDGAQTARTTVNESIFTLWGSSPTDMHAGGFGGAIFHYDGTSWTNTYTSTNASTSIFGLWGAGTTVFAVGSEGHILTSAAGGAWMPTDLPWSTTQTWHGVFGVSATEVWVVGRSGLIRKLTGSAWSAVNASACWGGDPAPHFRGVWASGPSNIFVVGGDDLGRGWICHYNGASWSKQEHPLNLVQLQLNAVWGRGPNDVFVVGNQGAIIHYDGVRWRQVVNDAATFLNAVNGLGSEIVIAGGAGTARRYAGAHYTSEWFDDVVMGVHAPTATHEYAMSTGAVYRSDSGVFGSPWGFVFDGEQLVSGLWVDAGGAAFGIGEAKIYRRVNGVLTPYDFTAFDGYGIGGRSPSDVFVVGDQAGIAHYNGSTVTVQQQPNQPNQQLYDVSAAPTVAYAVGRDTSSVPFLGILYKRTAAGWSPGTLPANTPPLEAVHALSDTHAIAVGDEGTVLETTDGTTWNRLEVGTTIQLLDVDATAADDIFVAGAGTLLHYDGVAWMPVKAPLNATGYISVRTDAIYVGGYQNITLIRRDPSW